MSTFTTYCDLGFLDALVRAQPDKDVLDYDEEDHRWLELMRFLIQHTDVVIKASDEELPALLQRQPLVRRLMDKTAGSRCCCDAGAFDGVEKIETHQAASQPWRLFLMQETERPQRELSAAYGTLFLDAQNALAIWQRIGRQVLLNVSRAEGEGRRLETWQDLQQFATPLTALLVCDRYMLTRMSQVRENVASMLVHLLPKGPNEVPVQIMLVTEEVDQKVAKLEKAWRVVHDEIRQQRPALHFELSLVKATGLRAYHDRHVFMNYGFMKSGHSFNYFRDGELNVDTTLDFHSCTNRDLLTTACEKLRELADIVGSTPEKIGLYTHVVGSKDHPLLEAVREPSSMG